MRFYARIRKMAFLAVFGEFRLIFWKGFIPAWKHKKARMARAVQVVIRCLAVRAV